MIYNIALTFDEETNKQIYQFYTKFKDNLNLDFGLEKYSIPHATVIKFKSQSNLSKEELDGLFNNLIVDVKIDFSGITFLPSHSKGCWIEISVLKNQQLIEIQNKLIEKLNKYKIKSGIKDRFRPHITFAKIKDSKINLEDLDYSLLRKKEVNAKLVIGLAESEFEFHEL